MQPARRSEVVRLGIPTNRTRFRPPTMTTWRVLNLEQRLDEADAVLRARACREVGAEPESLRGSRIARKSLDVRGRRKGRAARFVVHVDLELPASFRSEVLDRAVRSGRVQVAPEIGELIVREPAGNFRGGSAKRAVVVGTGPAGVFAGLVLARSGVEVDLIDRGAVLEERGTDLVRFHRSRVPDAESNLLFGEGGAGTYSDGKLYTRVDDPLEIPILEELVACGAPPEILYDARAHIGTDKLHSLLPKLRALLEAHGARFHWRTRMDGLILDDAAPRRVTAVRTTAGELPCDLLVLAPGHSARDTWAILAESGVPFASRAFQLGVRVEHPQAMIDEGRYGGVPGAEALGAASYNLVSKSGTDAPGAHSFCMCPGGRIVASVNEAGLLCTNGMSNSTHSSRYANAAIVTTFGPREFGEGAFAGLALQRELEQRFFEAGGSDYTAPAQLVEDFLQRRDSRELGVTSYPFGMTPGRIDRLLPERARDALSVALARFDRLIPGFGGSSGVMVGLESRSSGPVRIPRDRESFRAEGFWNLYPVGEGAGYAGGIMSAALDGARAAQSALRLGVGRV